MYWIVGHEPAGLTQLWLGNSVHEPAVTMTVIECRQDGDDTDFFKANFRSSYGNLISLAKTRQILHAWGIDYGRRDGRGSIWLLTFRSDDSVTGLGNLTHVNWLVTLLYVLLVNRQNVNWIQTALVLVVVGRRQPIGNAVKCKTPLESHQSRQWCV
jgi:hypothetical protein